MPAAEVGAGVRTDHNREGPTAIRVSYSAIRSWRTV
jgi:hypothetical protein